MNEIITVDEYTSLKIEDGGKYGWRITEGWIGREGDFKPNFCKREFKKGAGEKTAPVSVKLGGKTAALAALSRAMNIIRGGESGKVNPPPAQVTNYSDNEDVPF